VLSARSEPTIPAIRRLQDYALDSMAAGIGDEYIMVGIKLAVL
jgi:hypothetical protein